MYPTATQFLAVDDSATMRKIIKKVLGRLGYKNIEEADDGFTALPLLRDAAQRGAPFEFVISDWNIYNRTNKQTA